MSFRKLLSVRNAVGLSMVAAMLLAWWLTPQPSTLGTPDFAQIVPTAFGDWREIGNSMQPVDPTRNEDGTRDAQNPYDEVLMRTYANSRGDVVMMALAYGRVQRQEVKIHRPELCYLSQGFSLVSRAPVVFPSTTARAPVQGERMLVQADGRVEAVSYWIRIGEMYSRSPWETRYYIFEQGLKRREIDGVLVRVSQIVDGASSASEQRYELQERFIAELIQAIPSGSRHLLTVG
jgi:EpsI family protein